MSRLHDLLQRVEDDTLRERLLTMDAIAPDLIRGRFRLKLGGEAMNAAWLRLRLDEAIAKRAGGMESRNG